MTTCAYPGCNAPLGLKNRTGLCRSHNHSIQYCRCIQCNRKRDANTPPLKVCKYCGTGLDPRNKSQTCRTCMTERSTTFGPGPRPTKRETDERALKGVDYGAMRGPLTSYAKLGKSLLILQQLGMVECVWVD